WRIRPDPVEVGRNELLVLGSRRAGCSGKRQSGNCEGDAFHRRYPSQKGYFSDEQSRRAMPFSWAYCAAEASIIGRTIDWSDAIQSVSTFHCAPSHCCNVTAPP